MGVTVIRCEKAPKDTAPGCVWAKPSEDLLGVVSNQLWDGADAVAVEDVEGFAIVTVRTPFRIEMEDGSYILSRGRAS